MEIKVSPSLLSCNFLQLEKEVRRACAGGADMLHYDVMDGVFVNNISFGLPVLQAVKKVSSLPLDVHLMICDPLKYAEKFAECGADIITFHIETGCDVGKTIDKIRSCGAKAGVSLKPETPAEAVADLVGEVDMILVMTVEPGFGGQAFIPSCLDKISKLRNEAQKKGVLLDIEVDGGINAQTAEQTIAAGANVIVSGSYLFSADDMAKEIVRLKALQAL